MWYDEEKILLALNASELPDDEQQDLLDDVGVRIGEAIDASLGEQQRAEYRKLLDADQQAIFAWLNHYKPDYKDDPVYQELAEAYEEDPEKIQPEKIVATLNWVEKNVPNAVDIVAKTVHSYREERASTSQPPGLVQ